VTAPLETEKRLETAAKNERASDCAGRVAEIDILDRPPSSSFLTFRSTQNVHLLIYPLHCHTIQTMSPRTSTKPILPCHHQHPPSPPSAATSTTVRHSGGSSLFSGGRSTRTGGKKGKLGFHVHRDKRTGKKQLRPETEKVRSTFLPFCHALERVVS
jgi:hypothetical protein